MMINSYLVHRHLLAIIGLLGLALVASAQGKALDNIVVVLDASGSMKKTMPRSNQTRMEAAKQALLKIMQTVPAGTQVGLLVFSGRNVRNEWVYPLGHLNAQQFQSAVRPLEADGGTPLGVYMKKGSDRLMAEREKQHGYGTFRLLVLTDGEETEPKYLPTYLPDILSRGLTVDVIGVDMTADHALATRVHSYRRANDPVALTKAVSEVFAEVGGGRGNATTEESFAAIQALPDEVAKSMLAAMAPVGNHPIGEAPAVKSAPVEGGVPEATPLPSVPGAPAKESRSGGIAILIILGVIFVGAWAARQRRLRRGSR